MGLNTFAHANLPCGDRSPTIMNLRAFNNVKSLDAPFDELVGTSFALRKVIQMIETVAPGESTVLLQGETGTGKELVARAIHNRSPRRTRSFVKLNCAAIPTGLLESELFGHERVRLPGPLRKKSAALNSRIKVLFSWMKLATFHWNCNPNFCVRCKSGSSSVWAACEPRK